MVGEIIYKITVSRADSDVIKNLVDILENCPMDLNNDDYVGIMKTIAYHDYETDIDDISDVEVKILEIELGGIVND